MRHEQVYFSSIFKNNVFPRLLYITKQDFKVQKQERPVHSHSSITEISFVYKGKGIFNTMHKSYSVQTGDILLCNSGEEHEFLSIRDGSLGAYCLGFADVQFTDLPTGHLVKYNQPHVLSAGMQFGFLRELADQILECSEEDPIDHALMDCLSISFLLILKKLPFQHNAELSESDAAEMTTAVKNYISEHFASDITLDSIAEALSFSSTYISHAFKKSTGYSPIEYVIRRRIGYAQTMLISSDYTVSHIATLSGFDNPNHFQTTFKKIVGITPLQFRINYLESLHGDRNQA